MTNHRPRLRPLLLALGAGAMPGMAGALGLGGIEVKSALSQPFDAEIALIQDRPGEADLANVGLASAEAFARAGLDRRFFLTDLEFTVERRAGGPVVRVRSSLPVREPYLEFLVEAVWPGGNLLRQYTVLLDPPARPWAGVVDPAVARAPPAVRASAGQAGPQARAPDAPAWPKVDQFADVGAPAPGTTYGPVRPGDTLWAIAARAKPAGVGQAQAMVAILRANPNAFIGGDAARLMAGSTLVIPRAQELAAGDEGAARAQMAPYVPGWRRAGTATAAAAPAESAPGQPPSDTSARGPVEAAESASGAAPQPEVRLVQADTAGGPAGEGAPSANEVLLLEETLDAARQENAALRERLEALENQVAALSEAMGAAPAGASSAPSAAAGTGRGAADAGTAGVQGMVPQAPPAPGDTPAPEPRQEDEGGRPWALAAVAAGLVGGLGLLVARRRTRQDAEVGVLEPERGTPSPARRPAPVAAPVEEIEVSAVADDPDLPGTDRNASRLDLLAALVAARNTAAAREVYADIAASGDEAARAQADALMRGQA